MKIAFKTLIMALTGLFASVQGVSAARLYASSPPAAVCVGSTFTLQLLLDTQGEAINAGQVDLTFNPVVGQVNSLNTSGSVFKFFAEGPEFDNNAGTIHMIGGLPTPGYQGPNGLVAQLSFTVNGTGNPNLQYSGSSDILLDDGSGTSAALSLEHPNFSILPSTDPSCTTPVTCTNRTILEGGTANVSASGGDGSYTWTASGGTPASGTGGSFSVFYATAGSYGISVTDGDGKTGNCTVTVNVPGTTPPPATPGPTPTPCPTCQLYSDTGEILDLRLCQVQVECTNAESREFDIFLGADDPTKCPIVTRCEEDTELTENVVRNIFTSPLSIFIASSRGIHVGPFIFGIGLGAMLLFALYLLSRVVRRWYMRFWGRKERPPRYPDIPHNL